MTGFTGHSTRIQAIDSQFTFTDSNLTVALEGTENLYAITQIVDITTSITSGSSQTVSFAWSTSFGTFASGKGDHIVTAWAHVKAVSTYNQAGLAGATGGSDGVGGILGYGGVWVHCRKRGTTDTDGRIASIMSNPSIPYSQFFDTTTTGGPRLSLNMFSSTGSHIYLSNAWFTDSGISLTFTNADASTRTLDISGFGYGFC